MHGVISFKKMGYFTIFAVATGQTSKQQSRNFRKPFALASCMS